MQSAFVVAVDDIPIRCIRFMPKNVLKTREPACCHNSRRPDAAAYRRRELISGRANLPRSSGHELPSHACSRSGVLAL